MSFPQPAPSRPSHKPAQNTNGNSLAAKVARIDLEEPEDIADPEGNFEIRENYGEGSAEGESTWVVRGKEEDLDKIEAVLQEALEKAKKASHGKSTPSCQFGHKLICTVGILTGLPRSAFPRIIGSK